MMTTTSEIINALIKRKAEYIDNPDDIGGPTKFGINLETLDLWLGRKCTATDIQGIDIDTAFQIYSSNYLHETAIDKLPEAIQPLMLEMSINHSPYNAIKILQKVLLAHGKNIGKIDGLCGRLTQQAAKSAWAELSVDLIKTLVNRYVVFCEDIVKHDETQRKRLVGLITRTESFRIAKKTVENDGETVMTNSLTKPTCRFKNG
jgi:lysozyme family protein